MGKRSQSFSDLSGAEVDEAKLGKLVITAHPSFEGTPALIEALPEEVASLEKANLQVVAVEWTAPGETEPKRYLLAVKDFNALCTDGKMDDVLAVSQPLAKPKKASSSNGGEIAKMRTWLKEHGHDVGEKGRIPQELKDIYAAANPA